MIKWKSPFIDYPKPGRWILLVDKIIGATGGKIKAYMTCSPEDPEAPDHIPVVQWPHIFDHYIYMDELFHTLADENCIAENIKGLLEQS